MKVIGISQFILLLLITASSELFAQVKSTASNIETKSLEELYEEAIQEGGNFTLRAGGDKPDQIDYYLDMFKARFPKINVTHSVDYFVINSIL